MYQDHSHFSFEHVDHSGRGARRGRCSSRSLQWWPVGLDSLDGFEAKLAIEEKFDIDLPDEEA